MSFDTITCWEPTERTDRVVGQARRLYETTIDAAERIPWEWIERCVGTNPGTRADRSPHLILAADADRVDRGPVLGYYYGAFIRGYGGYGCYLGVDERARGRGVATALSRQLIAALQRDAHRTGEKLPFVIWDSHPPAAGDSADVRANWQVRLRLFEKLGARWIRGADFASPNWTDSNAPPVRLELFLISVEDRESEFDELRLREVVEGLARRVYRMDEDYELFRRLTASPGPLALWPAGEAR
jgi:ribosomal protein S18 acetylase RimI-like enzyme